MHVMFILMGFSLLAAIGFLIAFLWAVKRGQFDDRVTPAIRILFDDKPKADHVESGDSAGRGD